MSWQQFPGAEGTMPPPVRAKCSLLITDRDLKSFDRKRATQRISVHQFSWSESWTTSTHWAHLPKIDVSISNRGIAVVNPEQLEYYSSVDRSGIAKLFNSRCFSSGNAFHSHFDSLHWQITPVIKSCISAKALFQPIIGSRIWKVRIMLAS